MHVTLHVRKGVPSLRGSRLFRRLRRAFQRGRERFGFRLAHYSVQGNHLHFIAEAQDKRALSRGMQGLAIRIAKTVNRVHSRRGAVFVERYFARTLTTALHVRRALVYVLFNERHHLAQRGLSLPPWWLDSCSSAPEFTGFFVDPDLPAPSLTTRETTALAQTKLLSSAWLHLGRIRIEEEPARPNRSMGATS